MQMTAEQMVHCSELTRLVVTRRSEEGDGRALVLFECNTKMWPDSESDKGRNY